MFTARSIRPVAIESADPISLFIGNTSKLKKFVREICFYRLVGMNCQDDSYISMVSKIDEELARAMPNVPYIRMQQLKTFLPQADLTKYTQSYDAWHSVRGREAEVQFACRFPVSFQNETLEWSLKVAYRTVLDIYESETPNVTETMVRSFGVKMMYWIDTYVSKIYSESAKDMETFPKLLYVGNIKKQESLFLYFLAMLGWDILYMNPEGDISGCYKAVESLSKLHRLGETRRCNMPIPDFAVTAAPTAIPASANPASGLVVGESASGQINAPVAEGNPAARTPINIQRPPSGNRQTRQTAPSGHEQTSSREPGREMSYEELAAFSSSVVMIKVMDTNGECCKTGSGVVINQEGYILTNFHVVCGGSYYSVQFENETKDYTTDCLIKYHPDYDLALIRVDKPCKHINIMRQGNLVRGQKIVAIGSPLGLFNSVSDGIISGFRQIESKAMVQFTAPISHGSSGGALLDMQGQLVGIITSGFDQGQNLNLAVEHVTITQFIQNFIK